MAEPIKVFINYRRDDEFAFVESLHLRLQARYGEKNVFMDVEKLPLFSRFDKDIIEKVREADILVVVIGPRWVELLNQRAMTGATDFVRVEIEEALLQNKVIAPICIAGAKFPAESVFPESLKPIARLNAALIATPYELRQQINTIYARLDQLIEEKRRSIPLQAPTQPNPWDELLRTVSPVDDYEDEDDDEEVSPPSPSLAPFKPPSFGASGTSSTSPFSRPSAPSGTDSSSTNPFGHSNYPGGSSSGTSPYSPYSGRPSTTSGAGSGLSFSGSESIRGARLPAANPGNDKKTDSPSSFSSLPIGSTSAKSSPIRTATIPRAVSKKPSNNVLNYIIGLALLGLVIWYLASVFLNAPNSAITSQSTATAGATQTLTFAQTTQTAAVVCMLAPVRPGVPLFEDPTTTSLMVTAVEANSTISAVGRREVVGIMWYYVVIRSAQNQYFDGWLVSTSVTTSPPCNSLVIDTLH